MNPRLKTVTATALTALASLAFAEVPPAIAERLRAIGPVINPGATAPLYAPQFTETAPYVNAQVERDLAYGPHERHLLDVFTPVPSAGKRQPVLVFVHGGAFVAGNRRAGPASPFYDNVMLWAVHHGLVGVNMTYRLAPQDPWPAGPQDIGQALRWVQQNIAQRGGDPSRVFLFGHSAGAAHVAAYVAMPGFQEGTGAGLAGAMLLSGIYRVTPELVAQSPTYPAYFGNDASRYAETSSVNGLLATPTPLWIADAELDPPQFKAQARLLRDALRDAGRPFTAATFAAHSHMSEAYSINSQDSSVGDALWEFVKTH